MTSMYTTVNIEPKSLISIYNVLKAKYLFPYYTFSWEISYLIIPKIFRVREFCVLMYVEDINVKYEYLYDSDHFVRLMATPGTIIGPGNNLLPPEIFNCTWCPYFVIRKASVFSKYRRKQKKKKVFQDQPQCISDKNNHILENNFQIWLL